MKRTHSSSNLPPYQYRDYESNQRSGNTNKTTQTPKETKTDCLTVLPCEVLFHIFASSTSSFESLRSLASTCKTFKTVVYLNAFGKVFLSAHKIPLKTTEKESWFKTYRLWLQTNCYILLDCSASMDLYTLKAKTTDIIKKVATDAFNNQWRRGVTLGIFADDFEFVNFKSIDKLTSFLRTVDEYLEIAEIDKKETSFLPLLTDIYKQTNRQTEQKASPTEIHVLSDYKFTETDKIIPYLRDTSCYPSININFYDVNKAKNSVSIFLSRIKDLQPIIRKIQNRATLSIKDGIAPTAN